MRGLLQHLLVWQRLAIALVAAPLVTGCGATAPVALAPVAAPCDPQRIGAVVVTGAPASTVPALAVLEGTLDDPARTRRIARTALEALRWAGHARARIDVTRARGCFVELAVAVELGPRFEISEIAFDTHDEFPASERLAAIEDALGTVNAVGGVFVRDRLRRALDGLEQRYRDAGWLDARIGDPSPSYRDDAVAISIPVDAGPRYRIGAIRARGPNALARQLLLDELGVAPGAWYDGPTIRRGIARARRKLARPVELRTTMSAGGAAIELEAIVEARR